MVKFFNWYKRLPDLKDHSYDERLKLLNLERLELRRIWSDLLWCYKIFFGIVSTYM